MLLPDASESHTQHDQQREATPGLHLGQTANRMEFKAEGDGVHLNFVRYKLPVNPNYDGPRLHQNSSVLSRDAGGPHSVETLHVSPGWQRISRGESRRTPHH